MTDPADQGASDHASAGRDGDPPEGDFYRGGGTVAARQTTLPLPRIDAHDAAGPPAWAFYPLFLAGAVAGLFVFSAVWELLGGGATALLVALTGGVAVLAGTSLAGGLLWSYIAGGSDGIDLP